MADSPVQVNERAEEVQGQAHGQVTPPKHDGKHFVQEVAVVTDRVITDVNDPLAVQVPEGVGASHAGHLSPLGEALKTGTVEEQFERSAAENKDEDTATAKAEEGKPVTKTEDPAKK